eukprot:15432073-Alexandrium_andersonii.AAC.1
MQLGRAVTDLDDSNSSSGLQSDIQRALEETEAFDELSGQKVNTGKTVGWATQPDWQEWLASCRLAGLPIPVLDSGKLAGAIVVAAGPAQSWL